jgi:maleylpyruvate isomerase
MADGEPAAEPGILTALALALEGSDYFERTLSRLADDDFAAPSLLPGWSRAHVAAHVAYNAQGLLRLVTWAATGVEHPMYASSAARAEEIERGSALPASALRELNASTMTALATAWRSLSPAAWQSEIRTTQGATVRATATIWMRTREVWLHAVDLDSGASYDDFPDELVDHLLADVLSNWRGRRSAESLPNIVLAPTDREAPRSVGDPDDPDAVRLSGTAVELARWATGRGAAGVAAATGGAIPEPPRWL